MMKTKHIDERKAGRVLLGGFFDFRVRDEFKAAYAPMLEDPALNRIEVDLMRVEYIDSTALGMLLILKEAATKASKSVSVFNANGPTLHVLMSAKFDQLLPMQND